jgi:hypothetical protein
MRTAWGVFKAMKMTGIEDRGDFYRFWYNTVDLQPGEKLLASWKVIVELGGPFGALAGNLLLTDRRLILEPMSAKRAAYAPHGMKFVINGLASLTERKAPPIPTARHLADLTIVSRDGNRKATLAVTGSDGRTVEYFFSQVRIPTGTGHVQRRDEALNRIRAAAAAARVAV